MKAKKKETASNFYYVPITGAILHIVIYEDDSALVNSNFQKNAKWTSSELYNFIELYGVFGVQFIGTV